MPADTAERRPIVTVRFAASAVRCRELAFKAGMIIEALSRVAGLKMRVRITKPLRGSVDGIQLSRLLQGNVYDVNTPLACYLLSEEMAELAAADEPLVIRSIEKQSDRRRETRAKAISSPRALAAERARHARRKKKKES